MNKLSYSDVNEINKNNKNSEEEVSDCSTNTDITDDNGNNSRKQLKTFVCRVKECGKEYRNKYVYERHLETIHSKKTLRCDHLGCDYVTGSDEYLKHHLISHSNERPFTCITDGCGKTFKRKVDLNEHQITHRLKLFQCTGEGCGHRFKAKEYLKQHIKEKHSSVPKSYLCVTCNQSFDTKGKRLYHQRMVHHVSEEPIICKIDDCNQAFNRKHLHRMHVWRCHSGQEFRCDQSGCDYVTTKRDLITNHAKKHLVKKISKAEEYSEGHIKDKHSSTPKSYLCVRCNHSFDTRGKRLYHERKIHHMPQEPIVCKIDDCKQVFNRKYLHSMHVWRYHSHKEFRCDHSGCDYVTKSKDLMSRHANKHLKSRPFVCGIDGCVKAFKYRSNQFSHRKRHKSERYVCDVVGCKKIYKNKGCFDRHMKLFHSILYKCRSDGCLAALKSHYQFKVHLRQCHNRRSLSCDQLYCDYTTDDKKHLSKHVKKHLEEEFVCNTDDCGKTFKHKHNLKKHTKKYCSVLT